MTKITKTLIRVLLADDHPLVRAGIRTTLATDPKVKLVGEVSNGNEVVPGCQELQPAVLLLDLSMPGPTPVEILASLHRNCPTVKVLILSAYDDDAYLRGVINAGIAGFVLKDEMPETVLRAIHAVVQNDLWFSRHIIEKLARWKASRGGVDQEISLTEREREILIMVAKGYDNARIAKAASLTEQTIRNYLSRIYTTLGVHTRAGAIVWARERGLAGNESNPTGPGPQIRE